MDDGNAGPNNTAVVRLGSDSEWNFQDHDNDPTKLANYGSFLTSPQKFDLAGFNIGVIPGIQLLVTQDYEQRAISCENMGNNKSEYNRQKHLEELMETMLGSKEKREAKDYELFKFSIPVHENLPWTGFCAQCENGIPLHFVNGHRHMFHRHSQLTNPCGWLRAHVQFVCPECRLYHLYSFKMYSFHYAGYYVMSVGPLESGTKIPEQRGNNPPRKPRQTLSASKFPSLIETAGTPHGGNNERPWNEKCVTCQGELAFLDRCFTGCVTGHSSDIQDWYCPKCRLVVHLEEHDD
jgi:hypothetical protein